MKRSTLLLISTCLIFGMLLPMSVDSAELAVYGGTVLTLSVSEARPARVFAGTEGGTIFVSDDAGRSWTERSNGLIYSDINCLSIDPFNPDVVYAGTGGFGVFRSTDGGERWEQLIDGLDIDNAREVRAILPLPNRQGVILIATRHKIYRSEDRGGTWSISSDGLSALSFTALAADPSIDDMVFTGASVSGVFRSTDAGLSWESFEEGLPDSARAVACLATDRVNNRVLLGSSTSNSGVYALESGATSWQQLGLKTVECPSLAVLPSGTAIAGTCDGTMYFDASSSEWVEACEGLPDVGVADLGVYSILCCPVWGQRVVAGLNHYGVFATDRYPEGRFTISSDGLSSLPIVSFDCIDTNGSGENDVLWAVSRIGGVFKSTASSRVWIRSSDGIGGLAGTYLIVINPHSSDNLLAVTGDGIYESSDGGLSWAEAFVPAWEINDIIFHPTRPGVVYVATSNGLKRSVGSLREWETVAGEGLKIHQVEAGADGQVLYAGGWEFYVSTDGGDSWARSQMGLPEELYACPSVVASPSASQVAYASVVDKFIRGQHGVYVTRDGGSSWSRISADLCRDSRHVPEALVVTSNEEVLALTQDAGLYELVDPVSGSWAEVRPEDNPDIYREKRPITMRLLPDEETLVFGLATTVMRSDRLGRTPTLDKWWLRISDRLTGVAFAGDVDRSGVAGSLDRSAFVSTDGGASWTRLASGLDTPVINITAVFPGVGFLTGTETGLYCLQLPITGESAWDALGLSRMNVTALCVVSPGRRRGIWGGNEDGGLFYSGDGGQSWHSIDDSMAADSEITVLKYREGGVSSSAGDAEWTSRAAQEELWCGTGADGLFITPDNGQTWFPTNAGLPSGEIRDLCFAWDAAPIAVVADPGPWALQGDMWASVSTTGLSGENLTTAAYSDTISSLLVGDESGGVYVFSSELEVWETFDEAPTNPALVSSLSAEPDQGLVITRMGGAAEVLPLGPPTIQIHCNGSHFRAGDHIRTAIRVDNPGPGRLVDVHVAVATPEGLLLSWPTLSTELIPIFRRVMPANFSLAPMLVLDMGLPPLASGDYTFYAAITKQSSLEYISELTSASWTFE